jgi:diguanylate cyclase (GGDEF)-like protein
VRTLIANALKFKPTRPVRFLIWFVGIVAVGALWIVRVSTGAEYLFASIAILPVIAVSWFAGPLAGYTLSALAAAMWVGADLVSDRISGGSWIPLVNALTQLATYSLTAFLASQIGVLLAREQEMASHDALTGLLNRRAFFEVGAAEARRMMRYGHPLAIVFLDLDEFKLLNDTRGHETGDRALVEVAGRMRDALRETDHLARLGGDEFAVLLPEISYSAAIDTGDKLAASIKDALRDFPPVGASVGIAWFDQMAEFPDMIAAADGLMYEVKQRGKHGIKVRAFPPQASPDPEHPGSSTES